MLGLAVEGLVIFGGIGIIVLCWIQVGDHTGSDVARLGDDAKKVHAEMLKGFMKAIDSESHTDIPPDKTPAHFGFDAGRKFRNSFLAGVRADRGLGHPPHQDGVAAEERETNLAVWKLLSSRRADIEKMAKERLLEPAQEAAFRAFGEKNKPLQAGMCSAAWGTAFGKASYGQKALDMIAEYCRPSARPEVVRIVGGGS